MKSCRTLPLNRTTFPDEMLLESKQIESLCTRLYTYTHIYLYIFTLLYKESNKVPQTKTKVAELNAVRKTRSEKRDPMGSVGRRIFWERNTEANPAKVDVLCKLFRKFPNFF